MAAHTQRKTAVSVEKALAALDALE